MPIQIQLDEEQLERLEIFISVGVDSLTKISDIIEKLPERIIKPQDIENAIQGIVSDLDIEADVLLQQLMSMYSMKRRNNLSAKEVFDIFCHSIKRSKCSWDDTKFAKFVDLEPALIALLSQAKILHMVKALALPLDYTNLSQSIKILTDLRPVFNEEADEIVGGFVNYTLRLYYHSAEGYKSKSIILEEKDVENLKIACNRALTKAETLKKTLKNGPNVEIIET